MKWKFKVGDIIEHKASGEKAIITIQQLKGTYMGTLGGALTENRYSLDFSVKVSKSLLASYIEIAFKLTK